MSVNKVIILGNLGADPDVRKTQDGKSIVNLRLATSEQWKDKSSGEKREKTEWHSVVIFNEHLANLADQYLSKGDTIYIEGKLQTRKWQDNDGADRYSTEVVLENFGGVLKFVKTKGGSRDNSEGSPKENVNAKQGGLDDEVPF